MKIQTWINKGDVYYPTKMLGNNFGTMKRGHRVKSKYLPITETLEQTQKKLDWWAQDSGFKPYKPINDLLDLREDIEVSKTGELFAHSRHAKNAIDNTSEDDREIFFRIISSLLTKNNMEEK